MAVVAVLEFVMSLIADWYSLVLSGVIVLFFIPAIVLILFYAVAVFLYAYKSSRKKTLKDNGNWSDHFWDSARLSVCTFIGLLAKYWHAHDVVGLENVPSKGPALLCLYHGTLPIDVYYLLAVCQLQKRRKLRIVVDHFLFKLPGLKCLLDVFGCFTGPATECVKTLRNGNLLVICPGGVREAIFSSDKYELQWNGRIGFAKVGVAAKVPIIPVFTQNGRESFKVVRTGQSITRWIYEKTKIPLVLYYGGFPVKMRTYIGKPIEYNHLMSPEDVAVKVQDEIKDMIKKYQKTPGSVVTGLKDRWMPERTKID